MSGLAKIGQDDFSAGGFPEQAFEKVPTNGLSDLHEGLIGDDGLPFRRGGSSYLSTVNKNGGYFFWHGILAAGERVLWGENSGALWTLNGTTPQAVPTQTGVGGSYAGKGAVVNGILTMPDGTMWAGSLKTADYTAGTITLTEGSTTVVGAGTAFLANVDAGMLILESDGASGFRFYTVKSVTDNTHFELNEPFRGSTVAGHAYHLYRTAAAFGPGFASGYAAVANRLVAWVGDTLYESVIDEPQRISGNGDKIVIPGGVRILGAEPLRDQLLIFTTGGLFVLSNVALDLTDNAGNPQQRLELVNSELILWAWEGVTNWRNALIVPAIDGIYIVDAVSAPVRISAGIQTVYDAAVVRGVTFGQGGGYACVHKGHYLLPIRDNGSSNDRVLACRLIPTRRGRGDVSFGWSQFVGHVYAVAPTALETGVFASPELIGYDITLQRLLTLDWFGDDAADANGTAHVLEITTREYPVGGMFPSFVARFRARYELVNAGGTSTLELAYSIDGGSWVALSSTAPEATLSSNGFPWDIGKNAHGIRFRIRTTGGATKAMLHALEVAVRQSGRNS